MLFIQFWPHLARNRFGLQFLSFILPYLSYLSFLDQLIAYLSNLPYPIFTLLLFKLVLSGVIFFISICFRLSSAWTEFFLTVKAQHDRVNSFEPLTTSSVSRILAFLIYQPHQYALKDHVNGCFCKFSPQQTYDDVSA